MSKENEFWIYEKLQKVFVDIGTSYEDVKEPKLTNKDKAIDYEMETILAGFATDNFNEDDYNNLVYERARGLK